MIEQTRRDLKIPGKNPPAYWRVLMCQRCCHRWKADLRVKPHFQFSRPECGFGWIEPAYTRLTREGR
jgi:hypothetical protein